MIIKPRIRGFLCTTAHPKGCEIDVLRQIQTVRDGGALPTCPKRILVIGASGGYGLASRITAAFGGGASTVGVFFERPALKGRTASPGWYKSAAFEKHAKAADLYSRSINGDAFSDATKAQVGELIRRDLGAIDLVVYSLAAPYRQIPGGELVRSVLKPIGKPFSGKTIDFKTHQLREISLDAASDQEIADTVRVMGGEDWELWIAHLKSQGLLAAGCITTNYTYLGSEVTWPIYYHGTIGKAKEDLDRAGKALQETLEDIGGRARVVVMKGLLTQAASAIPGMSVYLSLLFKVMKERGVHEGCIEQTHRLFRSRLFRADVATDDMGRIRMDDWELGEEVQRYVKANWHNITNENVLSLTDFFGYKEAFLNLHGFAFAEVDYEKEVDPEWPMELDGGDAG